jgi:hypothetical protein
MIPLTGCSSEVSCHQVRCHNAHQGCRRLAAVKVGSICLLIAGRIAATAKQPSAIWKQTHGWASSARMGIPTSCATRFIVTTKHSKQCREPQKHCSFRRRRWRSYSRRLHRSRRSICFRRRQKRQCRQKRHRRQKRHLYRWDRRRW